MALLSTPLSQNFLWKGDTLHPPLGDRVSLATIAGLAISVIDRRKVSIA